MKLFKLLLTVGLLAGLFILNACSDDEPTPDPCSNTDLAVTATSDAFDITAEATGGASPYTFSIDGANFQKSGVFEGVDAGTYTVTVMDANDCKNITSITVKDACTGLAITAVAQNYSITATANGGTLPYEFSIDDTNFQSSAVFDDLEVRDYTITVRDAIGCNASVQVSSKNLWEILRSTGNQSRANSIAADSHGNIYIAGRFSGSAGFDGITVTGNDDIYLAKYTPEGTVEWVLSFNSDVTDARIAIDPNGDIYLSASFRSTITIGSETFTPTASGIFDTFLAKINNGGNVIWAQQIGGNGSVRLSAITTDNDNNVYLAGGFTGSITLGDETFTTPGGVDEVHESYLVKYSSIGDFVWAEHLSGTERTSSASITTDLNNNIYVTGLYTETATFGGHNLTSLGSTDIFLVKYNISGEVLWAKTAGGSYSNSNYSDEGKAVITDPNGNVYLTGRFNETAYFGGLSLTAPDNFQDVFLAKYNSEGSISWVKQIGSNKVTESHSLAIDNTGNIHTAGTFYGTMTLGDSELASINTNTNLFLATYKSNGDLVNAIQAGGPDHSGVLPNGMVSYGNHLYIAGFFYGNPTIGSTTLTSEVLQHYSFIYKVEN